MVLTFLHHRGQKLMRRDLEGFMRRDFELILGGEMKQRLG
jgi:hypothetical protein